jgi:hypothetical protein
VLREEKRVDCRLLQREREDLTVLIYTRQKTSERTNDITQQKTIERHDESRRLSDKSNRSRVTTSVVDVVVFALLFALFSLSVRGVRSVGFVQYIDWDSGCRSIQSRLHFTPL